MIRPIRTHRRPGAIAPMTACLLIPLVAMLAFAIDLGWITHTHNQLQGAADAAALAGAAQLADDFVSYHLPGLSTEQKATILASASTKAKTYAKTYAGHNTAGGIASLALADSDIELGYTDSTGKYTPLSTYSGYPNTVKVVMRRDATSNGALGLFFARALGIGEVNLTTTASACIYAGKLDGFQTNTSVRSHILPMTYDVNDWKSFLKGGPYPSHINVSTDSSGLPHLSIYPLPNDRGNFGQLSLDQSNDGASTIKDWIANGISGTDLQANYTKGLLPLSQHDANSLPDWKGNPGLKDSTIDEVSKYIGDVFLMPLFKPYNDGTSTTSTTTTSGNGKGKGKGNGNGNGSSTGSTSTYEAGSGNGSNYYYTIVEFVAVRVTYVDSTGNDKAIRIQPAAIVDPNALLVPSSIAPASPPTNGSSLSTIFVGAKLVR